MSSILVVSASRHGSTGQIAQAIADELATHGHEVRHVDVDDPVSLGEHDAFVLGSAVYAGHWVAHLRRFVEEHRHLLAAKPVWLFSSGPLGNGAGDLDPVGSAVSTAVTEPVEVEEYARALGARGHRLFRGRLDDHDLNLFERAAVHFVHAPSGDFRDWPEIREWAAEIAEEMRDGRADRAQGLDAEARLTPRR
jgi:menaquinone-dependent protoporphyrinogen oxidase